MARKKSEPHTVSEPDTLASFAKRIHPRKLNFSPRMAAIVGAVIGYDYGVRDHRGGHLTGLYITSDGFVMASSTAHDSGALLTTASELQRNLAPYIAELSAVDATAFQVYYATRVKDYRK
jgi:hypothetical protein